MMRLVMIIGLILIVFGVLSLGYEGITYVSRETVAEVGPVEIRADRQRTIWFSPVVGAVALAVGAGLLVVGMRPSTA